MEDRELLGVHWFAGWPLWRKILWFGVWLFFAVAVAAVLANLWVCRRARRFIVGADQVKPAQTAIVLGAYVYGTPGRLSPVLQDRVDTAIELFRAGVVDSLLMSGDHGQDDYDEVNWMRIYAEQKGVPTSKIFLDHAGFNTYDTMVRARRVFQVESAVVVTNRFHLDRAVFLALSQGIRAEGVVADKRGYLDANYYEQREFAARCKAFLNVYLLRPKPAFLGEPVPITGDAAASHDMQETKQ
jgi:SanA protein